MTGRPATERVPELADEEWLHEQYVVNGRGTVDIGSELGVSDVTVARYLREYGIEVRDQTRPATERAPELADKEWLREQYVDNCRTSYDIGNELGVSDDTVLRYLEDHGIERRKSKPPATERIPELADEAWLHEQYVERERSSFDIGDELNVTGATVLNYLQKAGIEPRSHGVPEGASQVRLHAGGTLHFTVGLVREFQFLQAAKSASVYLDEDNRRLGVKFHPNEDGGRVIQSKGRAFNISTRAPLRELDVYPSLLDEPHPVPYAVDEDAEFIAVDLSGSPAVWEVSDRLAPAERVTERGGGT